MLAGLVGRHRLQRQFLLFPSSKAVEQRGGVATGQPSLAGYYRPLDGHIGAVPRLQQPLVQSVPATNAIRPVARRQRSALPTQLNKTVRVQPIYSVMYV